MSTRRFLALAACSTLFLVACNPQANVTPPAEEGTETETPEAMEAEVEAEVEAEAAQ